MQLEERVYGACAPAAGIVLKADRNRDGLCAIVELSGEYLAAWEAAQNPPVP